MATQAYYTWVNAGRPWRLAEPIAELQAWARAAGVAVLGTIGNEAHLTADFPEDHTPFTYTAWPVPLPGYIVTAIDLANTNGLGLAIEANAKAGAYPWLKYMNHSGKNLDSRDGWRAVPNEDQHVHLSIRSDWIDRSIGTFDPWGQQMALRDDQDFLYLIYRVFGVAHLQDVVDIPGTGKRPVEMVAAVKAIRDTVKALAERPPLELTDAQLDALADKVAARLGRGTIHLSGTLEPGAQA